MGSLWPGTCSVPLPPTPCCVSTPHAICAQTGVFLWVPWKHLVWTGAFESELQCSRKACSVPVPCQDLGRIYRWKSRPCLLSRGCLIQCVTLGNGYPFSEPQTSSRTLPPFPGHICAVVGVRYGSPQDRNSAAGPALPHLLASGGRGPSFTGRRVSRSFALFSHHCSHEGEHSSCCAQHCPGF